MFRRLFRNGPEGEALPNHDQFVSDIGSIEFYSDASKFQAGAYLKTVADMRSAATRLLPLLTLSENKRRLSETDMQRLEAIEDRVTCLARQPLFFAEMFLGHKCSPEGLLTPLPEGDRIHLLSGGILANQDAQAIGDVYQRLCEESRPPLSVVEVGSAAGRGSTRIGASAIRRVGGRLFCIDPWTDNDWYFAFLANLRIFDIESIVTPIRSPSLEAAVLFEDHSLDAVFLDGSHLYDDVRRDIEVWSPKVRKGGILFGHDLNDLPSRFVRSELLEARSNNQADVTYVDGQGNRTRANVHPGVILAVQDFFGDDVQHYAGSVVWAKRL
jgi:hypothetical protein